MFQGDEDCNREPLNIGKAHVNDRKQSNGEGLAEAGKIEYEIKDQEKNLWGERKSD